jgi:hypothetical protein
MGMSVEAIKFICGFLDLFGIGDQPFEDQQHQACLFPLPLKSNITAKGKSWSISDMVDKPVNFLIFLSNQTLHSSSSFQPVVLQCWTLCAACFDSVAKPWG